MKDFFFPADRGKMFARWFALIAGLAPLVMVAYLMLQPEQPLPWATNLAAGDMCSIDSGRHWFKARADGFCYASDARSP